MIHREEENRYSSSFSYSYSYSYGSASGSQPSDPASNQFITQTNEENEATELTDIEDVTVDSVNFESNSSSLTISIDGDSVNVNAMDTSLEIVSADSNDMESVSLLAKSMSGLGIGFTALVALFSLRKRRRGSLN